MLNEIKLTQRKFSSHILSILEDLGPVMRITQTHWVLTNYCQFNEILSKFYGGIHSQLE